MQQKICSILIPLLYCKEYTVEFLEVKILHEFLWKSAALIDQSIISVGRCGETVSRRGTDVSDGGRVQETAVRVPEGHRKNHRNHRHQLQGIVGSRGRCYCQLKYVGCSSP